MEEPPQPPQHRGHNGKERTLNELNGIYKQLCGGVGDYQACVCGLVVPDTAGPFAV